jgi:type VI secretion system protein ImpA
MSALDPATLLAPVGGDDPCGPNLDSDGSYLELDRVSQGKPEKQIGTTIIPAEDPDWKAMVELSSGLLGRTKDIRLGVHLTNALLRTQGWPGFASGLAVLRGLVEQYWDGVYPRLDHESDDDPMERTNALLNLAEPSVLAAVRATPLITSRVFGRITLKDVEVAAGEAAAAAGGNGQPGSAAGSVDAAAEEVELATLIDTAGAVRGAAEALAGIEAAFTSRTGSGPGLSALAGLLKKARTFLDGKVAQRQPSGAEGGEGVAGGNGAPVAKVSNEVNSREDVIRALDKIAAYYARQEPSSPVPVLIERCKRLVSMSFIEIIRDLVPDGVNQVEVFRGKSE